MRLREERAFYQKNSKCKDSAWEMRGLLEDPQGQSDQETKEDEVGETVRRQMQLDLKACCKNTGFYSKNNVKLFPIFVCLGLHSVFSLWIRLEEHKRQEDQVGGYCCITGKRR